MRRERKRAKVKQTYRALTELPKAYAPLSVEDLRGFAEKVRVLSFGKRKKVKAS
jgi:hypothetical protein